MGTNELSSPSSPVHAIIFPFMSKGHTVPLLHFARILLHRHLAVTVFTTPANRPFVSQMVQDTAAAVIDLPFPHGIADIPAGVESTDKLPSISLFHAFASATSLMKPHFEHALRSLPRVTFMVSDAFLWWTLDSASKFGFHRFVFYGMSNYCHALYQEVIQSGFLGGPQPLDELVTLTRFPWIRVSKNDFDLSFRSQDHMFFNKVRLTAFNSYGRIVNSFYELEPDFADFVNREMSLKSWSVGPLCLAAKLGPIRKTELESNQIKKPVWVKWLDQKLEEKSSVLYVAFGSQINI
ncbi:hypothetical protein VNO77_20113 [Canavalia gladiata]|uniref:Uncharacterized protein n=1 Tax=Canavalia gladiata TaxID=3824 RepID=A0AAN9LNQ6_CANGL